MTFKKWISIENHYQEKYIEKFVEIYGKELESETFYIQEKIDGSSLSITFYPDGRWQFAKRSGLIKSDENFYNYKSAFQTDEMKSFMFLVSSYCLKNNITLQFIGELYGKGVQKRIYYGSEIYWSWFAIYNHISDNEVKNLTLVEIEELVNSIFLDTDYSINKQRIEYFASILGLERALDFDIIKNSFYTQKSYDKSNLIEGVVIRPFLKNYYLPDGSMLIIKKKNPDFNDKVSPKKEKRLFNVSENLQSLNDKTIGYVNENRTIDLFSKFGKITELRELGKFIGYYMKDVHSDIEKNYPLDFANLNKIDQKYLMKQLVPLIKSELMKEL